MQHPTGPLLEPSKNFKYTLTGMEHAMKINKRWAENNPKDWAY